MVNSNEKQLNNLFLAALNPYIQSNIENGEEKVISGKDFISWGDNNSYPIYLLDAYNKCATLQTVVNGVADYVTGDDIKCNVQNFSEKVNKRGETINDIIQRIAVDYLIFGAFALQIIRNVGGSVEEIYWIDATKLRCDKKNEVFFYSDDWAKSYGRVKYNVYPKFNPNDNVASSIFYFKTPKSRGTYGVPMWSASIKNVMTEIAINDFQLNEINNNFMSSKLISFNNGQPSDELKSEIEKNLSEKFGGSSNAGRVMIAFSDSKENAPEVLDLGTDDFADRYNTLEKRCREQIFIAFRATPVLFGLTSEANGFATNEYRDSYKLFNKTVVHPIQSAIVDTFDKIFEIKDSVVITPFTITFEE